ncbi:hypothetical protein NMN79_004460 [Salmonella enterica]|nr:hypothetical protein [Salmonella enterica]
MPIRKFVETLDDVPENLHGIYIPTEGGYRLDVEQSNLEQTLAAEATSAHLSNLISSWGGNADLLSIHLKDRVQAVIDPMTGKTVMQYRSAQGNPQTLDEFKKSVTGNSKYARLFDAGTKAGGGGGFMAGKPQQQQRSVNFTPFERVARARELLRGKGQ